MAHKESILNAATSLFAQKGFRDTSISDIARLAGTAEGTIFYHFQSKEDLFLAIFEGARARIVEHVETSIQGAKFEDGLDMVRGIASLYFFLSEEMKQEFLLLFGTYPYRLASENARCSEHLEAMYTCFLDVLTLAITRGMQDGSIRDVNPEKQSLIVLAMLTGLVRFALMNLLPAHAYYAEAIKACSSMLERRT